MKDRTRLIRTPSARIAPFCEVCGKVDGPLPFGRGEVRLHYHVDGARCEDHPLPVARVQSPAPVDDFVDAFLFALDDDDAFVHSFLNALEG